MKERHLNNELAQTYNQYKFPTFDVFKTILDTFQVTITHGIQGVLLPSALAHPNIYSPHVYITEPLSVFLHPLQQHVPTLCTQFTPQK